jgi:hypothetical protein
LVGCARGICDILLLRFLLRLRWKWRWAMPHYETSSLCQVVPSGCDDQRSKG